MSYFTLACPVCKQLYSTGVVGNTVLGGHSCPVEAERDALREAAGAVVKIITPEDLDDLGLPDSATAMRSLESLLPTPSTEGEAAR